MSDTKKRCVIHYYNEGDGEETLVVELSKVAAVSFSGDNGGKMVKFVFESCPEPVVLYLGAKNHVVWNSLKEWFSDIEDADVVISQVDPGASS